MQKKNSPAGKKSRKVLWSVCTVVFTLLFAVTMIGGPIANSYASIINMVLKTESTKTIGDVGETYFEADYASAANRKSRTEIRETASQRRDPATEP
ncbi:MAG: hypothetical protein ACLSDM_09245 [Butyricicoccus sp.]